MVQIDSLTVKDMTKTVFPSYFLTKQNTFVQGCLTASCKDITVTVRLFKETESKNGQYYRLTVLSNDTETAVFRFRESSKGTLLYEDTSDKGASGSDFTKAYKTVWNGLKEQYPALKKVVKGTRMLTES